MLYGVYMESEEKKKTAINANKRTHPLSTI